MHIKDARISNKFAAMANTARTRSWPNQNALAVLLPLLILALAGCGGGYLNPTQTRTPTPNPTSHPLVQIAMSANSMPYLGLDETVQLNALAGYSYPPNEIRFTEITNSATWSTSNAAVATVDKGVITGAGMGSVTITAAYGGETGSMTVVVGLPSTIAITPTGAKPFSISATPQQFFFSTTATYSDGTVMDVTDYGTWTSNPTGIVSFYLNSPGDATFLAPGATTITATFKTGEATENITVTP
jgi:hypothetical protein